MSPSLWDIMKRSTSNSPPTSKIQKMAPGLTIDSDSQSQSQSRSSGSSLEVTSKFGYVKNEDYNDFMSDVLVVGAGPAGLMLA
jgi:phenol 2-monooxygenase (NADPH)